MYYSVPVFCFSKVGSGYFLKSWFRIRIQFFFADRNRIRNSGLFLESDRNQSQMLLQKMPPFWLLLGFQIRVEIARIRRSRKNRIWSYKTPDLDLTARKNRVWIRNYVPDPHPTVKKNIIQILNTTSNIEKHLYQFLFWFKIL